MIHTTASTSLASQIVTFTAAIMGLAWVLKRTARFIVLSVRAFETIQKELNPNGGGSTYDLVRQLKEASDGHEQRLTRMEEASAASTAEAKHTALVAAEEVRRHLDQRIDDVVGRIDGIEERSALREADYVRALKKMGVDLTHVTQHLDQGEAQT